MIELRAENITVDSVEEEVEEQSTGAREGSYEGIEFAAKTDA